MKDCDGTHIAASVGHNFNKEADNEPSWQEMMAEAYRMLASNARFEKERAAQRRIDEIRSFIPDAQKQKYGLK